MSHPSGIPPTLINLLTPLYALQTALHDQGLTEMSITVTSLFIELDFSSAETPLVLTRPLSPIHSEASFPSPPPLLPSSSYPAYTSSPSPIPRSDSSEIDPYRSAPSSPVALPFVIYPEDADHLPPPAYLRSPFSDVSTLVRECTAPLTEFVYLPLNLPAGLTELGQAVCIANRVIRRGVKNQRLKLNYYYRLGMILYNMSSSDATYFRKQVKWTKTQYFGWRRIALAVFKIFNIAGPCYISQISQVTVAMITNMTDEDFALVVQVLTWHHETSPDAKDDELGI